VPRRRLVRVALLAAAALAGASVGRAATSANTVPGGRIGQGSRAATAYAISNVGYSLDVNDPRTVAQVRFTISPTGARVVRARLSDGGSWYACANVGGSVTCSTPGAQATGANRLTVVATQ